MEVFIRLLFPHSPSSQAKKSTMATITENVVLKNYISEESHRHPFSIDFNENRFAAEYAGYYLEYLSKTETELTETEIKEFFSSVSELNTVVKINSMYKVLLESGREVLEKLNFTPFEVMESVLKLSNFSFLDLTQNAEEQTDENWKTKKPSTIDDQFNVKITNTFGDKLTVVTAVDITIDIVNEVARIVYGTMMNIRKSKEILAQKKVNALCRELMIAGNLIFNLRDAFDSYFLEFGKIEYSDGTIHFKKTPDHFYFICEAGRQRLTNNLQEKFFYTAEHVTETFAMSLSISRNTLNWLRSNAKIPDIVQQFGRVNQAVFYMHLHLVKIEGLSCDVKTVFSILDAIAFLYRQFDFRKIVDTVIATQSENEIPSRILKKDLVRYINQKTGITNKVINKVLLEITQVFSAQFDLWSKPLISYGDYYYFVIPALAQLNHNFIVDGIISKYISEEQAIVYFRKYLLAHIFKSIDDPYQFVTHAPETVSTIAIETRDNLILMQPCLFRAPLSPSDYDNALELIAQSVETLESSLLKMFAEYFTDEQKGKKLIKIIITNYPSLSGLNVEGCRVMDQYLINNYFHVGRYVRGQVLMGESRFKTTDVATIDYYNNEDEFNKNFRAFCISPMPVEKIIETYSVKEYPINFEESYPRIFVDGIEKASFDSQLHQWISEIGLGLKRLYYFESAYKRDFPEEKQIVQEKIEFLLPQVLSAIAFNNEDRMARIEVLDIFKKIDNEAIAQLVLQFDRSLLKLNGKKLKSSPIPKPVSRNVDLAVNDLKEIIRATHEEGKALQLSTLQIVHSLDEDRLKNVRDLLQTNIGSLTLQQYTDEELNDQLGLIIVFVNLFPVHERNSRVVWQALVNFLDLLNHNFHYQKASDFAEEVLAFSFNNNIFPNVGWLCMLKCFLKQKNIIDAAFYGSLFLHSFSMVEELEKDLLTDALYNVMLFFRDFGFDDIAESIILTMRKIGIAEYDDQKITISLFYNRLQGQPVRVWEKQLPEIEAYLAKKIDEILSYEEHATIPWISLLYNIPNIKKHGLVYDTSILETYLAKLETTVSHDALATMKARYFPMAEASEQFFKTALIKIFETRHFDDFSFEMEHLRLPAKNVFSLSINPVDLGNLLLCGLVFNDNSLTFESVSVDEVAPFLKRMNTNLSEHINHYSDYILSGLQLQQGQVLVWLTVVEGVIYQLSIFSDKQFQFQPLTHWQDTHVRDWLATIADFSFTDNGDYPINEQEHDYLKYLDELSFAKVHLPKDCRELLVYSDLKLSAFPPNLLQYEILDRDASNMSKHVDVLKEKLLIHPQDFISYHLPVANIISLEWFVGNNQGGTIPLNNFSAQGWIPVADEDMTLTIGNEKLKPILEGKYGFPIDNNLIPDKPLHASINIVMAHGGKGDYGFKTFYTRQNSADGHAFIKEEGVERIFGEGYIAIVFVCHSASIVKDVFSQKLVSFVHHILSLGYKTVIAPAWALNPDICPGWLDKFISSMLAGSSVSIATHLANIEVAMFGYNQDHGFYAPTGWAAMHVYGNPNTCFS